MSIQRHQAVRRLEEAKLKENILLGSLRDKAGRIDSLDPQTAINLSNIAVEVFEAEEGLYESRIRENEAILQQLQDRRDWARLRSREAKHQQSMIQANYNRFLLSNSAH